MTIKTPFLSAYFKFHTVSLNGMMFMRFFNHSVQLNGKHKENDINYKIIKEQMLAIVHFQKNPETK